MTEAGLCCVAGCGNPATSRSMVMVLPGVVARRLPVCDRCFDEAAGDLGRLHVSFSAPAVVAPAAPPAPVATAPVNNQSDLDTMRKLTARLLRGRR